MPRPHCTSKLFFSDSIWAFADVPRTNSRRAFNNFSCLPAESRIKVSFVWLFRWSDSSTTAAAHVKYKKLRPFQFNEISMKNRFVKKYADRWQHTVPPGLSDALSVRTSEVAFQTTRSRRSAIELVADVGRAVDFTVAAERRLNAVARSALELIRRTFRTLLRRIAARL